MKLSSADFLRVKWKGDLDEKSTEKYEFLRAFTVQ